jgi:predicted TPR repeat methyltransferase
VLHEALAKFLKPDAKLDILDLGCGTGLCGVVLKPYASRLTGVDLSPAMLDQAKKRGIFDELETAEVTGYLQKNAGRFDLVAAGDVLVYIGELSPVFEAARKALRPGGLFAFTAEQFDGTGYALGDSMRYAHSRDYLEQTARAAGFEVRMLQETSTRKENRIPVPGWIVVLAVP